MTREEKRSVTGAFWSCIGELSSRGRRFTSHDLVSLLEDRYPDVAEDSKERFYREGITRLACRLMKSMRPRDAFQQLLILPPELEQLELPHAISLRCEPNEEDEDESGPTFVWIPLCDATRFELEEHVRMLRKGIADDQRRLKDLTTLQDYLQRLVGDEHTDEPIGLLLKQAPEAVAA